MFRDQTEATMFLPRTVRVPIPVLSLLDMTTALEETVGSA